jgi:hypothetical protein
MATGGVAALTAGRSSLVCWPGACGHSAPRTREVSVVVNEVGDPQQLGGGGRAMARRIG